MTVNAHLAPQLDAFIALDDPGFALLINAPWGAGKTYARHEYTKGKDHLYVSLFGVPSATAIEEALFQAMAERADVKIPQGLSNAFSDIAKNFIGINLDLTAVYKRQVLKALPKVIIFNDLERAQMPIPQLLAAFNSHVEHEKRNLIFLANEAKLEAHNEYREWREKVVGRTITLRPETESAIDVFLAKISQDGARKFLEDAREIILQVFNMSNTDNLRLLRQALAEFARLYERIPNEFSDQVSAMEKLFGDFLALSIAWHAGNKLTPDDFKMSAAYWIEHRLEREKKDPMDSGLLRLRKTYVSAPFAPLDGRNLPDDLARILIVDGYAPDDQIEAQMKLADAFKQTIEEPWRVLWWWRKREESEVIKALDEVQSELKNKSL